MENFDQRRIADKHNSKTLNNFDPNPNNHNLYARLLRSLAIFKGESN